jgi:Putative peptidoglycan binding domain
MFLAHTELPNLRMRGEKMMKHERLVPILVVAGVWLLLNARPAWSQTTPAPGKSQTEMKDSKGERTGEEKMDARGAQDPGPMGGERKKGETEMEARGAQKPGRMEKPGAEVPENKQSRGEQWTKDDVKKAQEALKSKGHDPGSIDGTLGPKTRQAISAFQKANGLKETGSLDTETATKLGVEKTRTSRSPERASSSSAPAGMDKAQTSPAQKQPSSPQAK